jgi:hypothetical protein
MATMATTFTASGSFTLTDENGVVIFTYSPSFTSVSNTAAKTLYAGEHLAGTSVSELALLEANDDRVYLFVKNVDTDYNVEVEYNEAEGTAKEVADLNPGEFFFAPAELNGDGTGDSITVKATTAPQKVQYLICDAINN